MMKVRQLMGRKGKSVANQFVIEGDNTIIFQSYDSMIMEIDCKNKEITIGEKWNYSSTTSKHRNAFCREELGVELSTRDIQKMLNTGRGIGKFSDYTVKEA